MARWLVLLPVTVVLLGSFGTDAPDARATQVSPSEFASPVDIAAHVQALPAGSSRLLKEPRVRNLELLGFHDLGGRGFNTDVWAHGDFAYVGTFGVSVPERPGLCPGTGVKVVDISDPTVPRMVAAISSPEGSRAADIKVAEIDTGFFSGDLLIHSIEPCARGGPRGFALYDVSEPATPVNLSEVATVGGVHNAFLLQRDERAFVLLAVPAAEVFSDVGDFQIFEITDPANPVLLADWGAGKDGGFGPVGLPFPPFNQPCALCRGDSPQVILHDVWANEKGKVAYLSYWDAGLILLDISDPAHPALIGRGEEPPTFMSNEGNAHAAVPARGGDLVLVTDEDFTPVPWGFLRVFDTSDPANPVQVGAFALEAALTELDPAVVSTAHNIFVHGDRAYVSWYEQGIRVVDFSNPRDPQEVGRFVAGPVRDPNGFFSSTAGFWGVFFHKDLILGSHINGGLFVLKHPP